MTAERRKKSGLPGAREGPATPASEAQARAYLRLRQLYEISKLLTSFENVEETITAIVGLVGEALSLRSVIFILESVGPPRTIIWKANAESEERLREAKAHARGSYSYLVRSGVDLDAVAARPLPGPLRDDVRLEAEDATSFVLLPLVVDHRPIFGALQFETAPRLDELDLVFVKAVVSQLAAAIDRYEAIEAQQAKAEARRAAAEVREAHTEAERSWLKTVLDRMPAGVIIGEAPGGELLLANKQAEQIWERPIALGAGTAEYRECRGFHPEDG